MCVAGVAAPPCGGWWIGHFRRRSAVLTLIWRYRSLAPTASLLAQDPEPLRTDGQEQGHRVGCQADRKRGFRQSCQRVPAGAGSGPGRRPRPAEARRAVPEDEEAVRG